MDGVRLLLMIIIVSIKLVPLPWILLSRLIKAHGTAVGLPSEDDMGNSEVGPNALGAGLIFAQGSATACFINNHFHPTCFDGSKSGSILKMQRVFYDYSAASIPRSKSRDRLQLKLVHNQWAPFILYFLRWLDCSCLCLRPTYLSLFHVTIYKVNEYGKPTDLMSSRRATIKEFYAIMSYL